MCRSGDSSGASGSDRRQGRRGVILPLIAGLILLVALSAFLAARFGSGTRRLVLSSRHRRNLADLVDACLDEARASFDRDPGIRAIEADSWWHRLVPPFAGDLTKTHDYVALYTIAMFCDSEVEVEPVKVRCLHRGTKNGVAQGLLSLTAEAKVKKRGQWGSPRTLRRIVLLRYLVAPAPDDRFAIRILPDRVASETSR